MEEKRPPRNRVLILIGAFVVLFGLYEALCYYHVHWIVYLYGALLLAALIAYVFVNSGFRREPLTEDLLPDRWDEARKQKYLASCPRRRKISMWLLLLIVPLLFTFAIDFVILRFFSGLY